MDKLFSHIGASDDLAARRSTFPVEMLEIASILNQATERTLVILDEVGWGTSTHDELAIAQATVEHLHDLVRCRTLIATHFHKLADAATAIPHAACMAVDASAGRLGSVLARAETLLGGFREARCSASAEWILHTPVRADDLTASCPIPPSCSHRLKV